MPETLTPQIQAAMVATLGTAMAPKKQTIVPAVKPPTPTHDPTQLYIPPECRVSTETHRRIAIIGGPGSGKTYSCLSFPNRIWANFDRKLPPGEQSLDFWDSKFCDKYAKRTVPRYTPNGMPNKQEGMVPNTRDAFKFWLRDNHSKFHEDQTFLLDSWTFLMNAFASQTNAEDDELDPSNKYFFYKQQLRYCKEIMDYLHAMRCLVVVTFHESLDRDEKGELNGKIRPLMDGQFKDQLLGHFTDVWRQRANIYEREKNGSVKRVDGIKQLLKTNHNGNPDWVWYWQLLGDTEFDTNCNPTLGEKVRKYNKNLVPADFNEVLKIYQLP